MHELLRVVMNSDLFELPLHSEGRKRWSILICRMNNGQRAIELCCTMLVEECYEPTARLPLGTISTVAELKDWYQRLGGKGWE